MIVKRVLLNFNMPVHFSIRESENKYRNIDSRKLALAFFFLLEWVRVTDFNRKWIRNESEMTSYTNMEHLFYN